MFYEERQELQDNEYVEAKDDEYVDNVDINQTAVEEDEGENK